MRTKLRAADGHEFVAWEFGAADAELGVVVLPEIFGITAHIQDMAAKFAAAGYRAICPSLFDRAPDAPAALVLGYESEDMQRGLAIRRAISDASALLDIQAAIDSLAAQRAVMITGFCWGGYLSWRAACLADGLSAAVCWYGGGIANHSAATAKIPVQMHFGGADAHIPQTDVENIKKAQPSAQIHVYPGAGHAFAREGTSAWHESSAALALQRSLDFFSQAAQSA